MYNVYAIQSAKDNRIYVGFTINLERRVKEHNNGKTKSTKYYRPWFVIYSKVCGSREEARGLEIKLKSGYGKEYLKQSAPIAHKDRAAVS